MSASNSPFENSLSLDNMLLDTDSYKYSHPQQFPRGTEYVFVYVEPRKANGPIDQVVFFGLQVELAQLAGQVITQEMLDEATPFIEAHGLTLYVEMFQHIIDEHGGHLPIRIDALAEGTITPVSVPQMRIVNTDPKCWALPGFLETRLLRSIWYPSTVATISNYVVNQIRNRLIQTDGSDDGFQFKLHDFGARGASSGESAGIGGAAHLVNSMGTDTVAALVYARNYYGADMAGFSIPATEHSTVTSFGEDGELEFMRRFLTENPSGIIACVSDSYDIYKAVSEYWGEELRDQILGRDGVLVVRPDSGDPMVVVPRVLEALMDKFGYSETPYGFKLLPNQIRIIQGDGINKDSIVKIMDKLIEKRLAIGNIAFGMGAGLLQKIDRDTFSYSMKTSAVCVKGEWRDVYKDPITARGSKSSKRGRMGVELQKNGEFAVRPIDEIDPQFDLMQNVFLNGEITNLQTFDQVRKRVGLLG